MAKISGPHASSAWAKSGRLLLPALLLAVAGCTTSADRIIASTATPDDYRELHPIALVNEPQTLDVFVAGRTGGIDLRTADKVREFAAEARARALGQIVILLPQGSGHDWLARAALPGIERALAAGGVREPARVGTYPVADPALAAPVRLSFATVKAKVASQCGQWPRDLASASSVGGWDNRHYWNYGCAYQSNVAAQVADPRDLVAARAEEPSDIEMRMRAIGAVRRGTDPGTAWVIKNSNLGAVGTP